jgi:hypothetical protein
MDRENEVGKIFESFLDDIYDELGSVQQKASTKVVTDVIEKGRPIEDFPFTMQFQINHLGKESRKDENEFVTRLKKFDEEFRGNLEMCPFIEDFSRLTYMIMNDVWNNAYYRRNEDFKTEFDFNDLHFYNEENFGKHHIEEASQFDVSVGIEFAGLNYNNLIQFVKQLRRILQTSVKYSFPEGKFADVTFVDAREGEKSARHRTARMDVQRMLDFENRLDNRATKEAYKKLQMVFFDSGDQDYINKQFDAKKQKYSTYAQLVIKTLDIDDKKMLVSETDKTLFVEIPKNEKLTVNLFAMTRVYELMKKYDKYFLITVNGELIVKIWYLMIVERGQYTEADKFEYMVNHCLYSTINALTLKIDYAHPDYVINLTNMFIKEFKAVFAKIPTYRLSAQQIKNYHIPVIKFTEEPKKVKIVDNTKNQK